METTTLYIPKGAIKFLKEANPTLNIVARDDNKSATFPVETPFICVDASTLKKILLKNPNTLFEQTGHFILSINFMAVIPSAQNSDLVASVTVWNRGVPVAGRGYVFDGQAEFQIPDPLIIGGGKRRADVAYMSLAKYTALPLVQRQIGTSNVMPDMVIENKSYGPGANNTLASQKAKMDLWITVGVQFGILVCGELRRHYLYCHVPPAAAGGAVPVPLVAGAVQRPHQPTVYRRRVDWPAPVGANPQFGPAIVINGVGLTLGMAINLSTYPLW